MRGSDTGPDARSKATATDPEYLRAVAAERKRAAAARDTVAAGTKTNGRKPYRGRWR
jgi:hypothetical protein